MNNEQNIKVQNFLSAIYIFRFHKNGYIYYKTKLSSTYKNFFLALIWLNQTNISVNSTKFCLIEPKIRLI